MKLKSMDYCNQQCVQDQGKSQGQSQEPGQDPKSKVKSNSKVSATSLDQHFDAIHRSQILQMIQQQVLTNNAEQIGTNWVTSNWNQIDMDCCSFDSSFCIDDYEYPLRQFLRDLPRSYPGLPFDSDFEFVDQVKLNGENVQEKENPAKVFERSMQSDSTGIESLVNQQQKYQLPGSDNGLMGFKTNVSFLKSLIRRSVSPNIQGHIQGQGPNGKENEDGEKSSVMSEWIKLSYNDLLNLDNSLGLPLLLRNGNSVTGNAHPIRNNCKIL